MPLFRGLLEVWLTDLVPLAIATAIACLFAHRRRPRYLGWLFLYILIDDAIGMLPILLHWNFGQWNWIGQTASLIFSFAVAKRFFSNEEIGLRLPRSRPEIAWTIAGVAGALTIATLPALFSPGTRPDAETFAYQALLPGLVEELAFRGVGLALLLRTFSEREEDRRAEVVAVLLTAVWFTSGHAFQFDNGRFFVVWRRLLDVFPMAIWYAVVRLRSRSLLGSILAHNGANTLVEIIAAFRF